MILCSECHDDARLYKEVGSFDAIFPQRKCDKCGRNCLGYSTKRYYSWVSTKDIYSISTWIEESNRLIKNLLDNPEAAKYLASVAVKYLDWESIFSSLNELQKANKEAKTNEL